MVENRVSLSDKYLYLLRMYVYYENSYRGVSRHVDISTSRVREIMNKIRKYCRRDLSNIEKADFIEVVYASQEGSDSVLI